MSELPRDWRRLPLEAVVSDGPSNGYSPKSGSDANGALSLKLSATTTGRLVLNESTTKRIYETVAPESKLWLMPGDILIQRSNTLEYVGTAAIFDGPARQYIYPDLMMRVRAREDIVRPGYLVRALNAPATRSALREKATGTAGNMPKINGETVRTVLLDIPPIAEQERIVTKLDALQSRSRRAKEALDAIPPLLERFRQSVLAAAFRGDLTAEWRAKNPDVEPASELLKRIRTERRHRWEEAELAKLKAKGKTPGEERWMGKYAEPEPVGGEGLWELPEGWCWATIGELADLITGGTPPGKQDGCYGGEIAFLKPTDLDAGRHVLEARQYLTGLGASFLHLLPANSVLITCIGATIGKTGLARVQCATNQQINAAVPILVDPEYLYWFTVGLGAQQWIVSNASATTLPILNKGRLAKMPVPVAPYDEQRELSTRLASYADCWVSAGERTAGAHAQLSELDRAILAKAFRGELVPQDPTDEPASALLARIAAERNGPSTPNTPSPTTHSAPSRTPARRPRRPARAKA